MNGTKGKRETIGGERGELKPKAITGDSHQTKRGPSKENGLQWGHCRPTDLNVHFGGKENVLERRCGLISFSHVGKRTYRGFGLKRGIQMRVGQNGREMRDWVRRRVGNYKGEGRGKSCWKGELRGSALSCM